MFLHSPNQRVWRKGRLVESQMSPTPQKHAREPSPSRWELQPQSIQYPLASRPAFTLIELLIVISIIAILIVLTMPAIGRVIGSANSLKCVSNLKQIGSGTALYVADHNGRFPGPLSGGQFAEYSQEDDKGPSSGRFSQHLQGYISPDVPIGGGNMVSPLFVCPAFLKVMKTTKNAQPYYTGNNFAVATNVDEAGNKTTNFACGYGAGNPTNWGAGSPIASISGTGKKLCDTWFMIDLDRDVPGVANYVVIPDHPVHPAYIPTPHAASTTEVIQAHRSNYRNALFYDFHVGRLNLDNTPK